MAYPAPPKPNWNTQIEFWDGNIIYGVDDEDALTRWRRLASWTDPTAIDDPADWQSRVIDRARVAYGATLNGVTPDTAPTPFLDALADGGAIMLRRR